MIAIPVPDLLQMSHPGYNIINTYEKYELLSEREIPTVLDFARCLTERFNHYGEMEIAPIGMFPILCESFQTLLESDDPEEVLPVRASLMSALHELKDTFDKMSAAFPVNEKISQFYRVISQSLYAYADSLINGGWVE